MQPLAPVPVWGIRTQYLHREANYTMTTHAVPAAAWSQMSGAVTLCRHPVPLNPTLMWILQSSPWKLRVLSHLETVDLGPAVPH